MPCPKTCPGHLSPVPSPSLAVLVGALVYPDHGAKRHQIAIPPQPQRIETCRTSAVEEKSILAAQLVSEKTRELAERNLGFRDGEHQRARILTADANSIFSRSAVCSGRCLPRSG